MTTLNKAEITRAVDSTHKKGALGALGARNNQETELKLRNMRMLLVFAGGNIKWEPTGQGCNSKTMSY